MFAKKVSAESKKVTNKYRFNINDPVLCVVKDCKITNALILSRNKVSDENFYKIGNKQDDIIRVCKERELIHR